MSEQVKVGQVMDTMNRPSKCRRLFSFLPGVTAHPAPAYDSPAMVAFGRQRLPSSDVSAHSADLASSGRMSLLKPFVEGLENLAQSGFPVERVSTSSRCCKGMPFANLIASFLLATRALLSYDAILGCVLAFTSVYIFCNDPDLDGISANMDWNLVSMAVIFPISQCIGWAFSRREQALALLGTIMALMTRLWSAKHTWVAKNDAGVLVPLYKLLDYPEARADYHELYGSLLASLVAYLDHSRYTRARHALGLFGADRNQMERKGLALELKIHFDGQLSRVQAMIQEIKARGLNGGEAHRLDSYVSQIGVAFDQLTMIKEYRTPQIFRAFSRVYVLLMPFMYGPYYAYLAEEAGGKKIGESGFSLAVIFAIAVQLAVSGLVNLLVGLEDPFATKGKYAGHFDTIRVADLAEEARLHMLCVEKQSRMGWNRKMRV
jgi:hypothetical protein